MFKCKICNKEFEKQIKLASHYNSHKKITCYCNICGKGPFESQTRLKGHLSSHFRTKKSKNKTIKKETKNKKHICEFCGKEYNKGHQLGGHKVNCTLNPNREKRLKTLSLVGKGKILSEEHKRKISISRKKYLDENPGQIPYLLNHSSKESYPEKLFREYLEKLKITGWIQEYPYKRYSLDFAFVDKKINVEIDGSTHKQDIIIKKDIIRDNTLINDGWKVIRIKECDVKKNIEKVFSELNSLFK